MLYPYIKEAGLVWMMPIIFLSFCSVAFCLERLYYWMGYCMKSWHRGEILEQLFHPPKWDLAHAKKLCSRSEDIVIQTLHAFLCYYENMNLAIAERKAYSFGESKVEESRHFLDLLAMISNIAGTLGLMGTVVGISLSFKTMANEDSKGIATSLSTAMYTTIGGIVLFLISYIFWFFLQKFSDQVEGQMETYVLELKNILEHEEKSKMVFVNSAQKAPAVTAKKVVAPTPPKAKPAEAKTPVEKVKNEKTQKEKV